MGSFDIYTVANKDEFWGTDGEFKVTQEGIGRKSVQNFYVRDVGWKKKDWGNAVNVADKLKEWYKPFKGRKVKWSGLGEGCSAWSKVRGRKISDLDSDIQALCYYR